jgi:hypothetical protein
MKGRGSLGVLGPFGLELGLEFGLIPGPLSLYGPMIGLELIVQIQQLAQARLKRFDLRPGRIKLYAGQLELFVQPGPFPAVCLLGGGKGTMELTDLPAQLFALLLKLLLAPGQFAAKLCGFGCVCLPQGGQPFQLIELRGKIAVALPDLLGKIFTPCLRSIQGLAVPGNSLFELITLGLHVAELKPEVPNLLSEPIALYSIALTTGGQLDL